MAVKWGISRRAIARIHSSTAHSNAIRDTATAQHNRPPPPPPPPNGMPQTLVHSRIHNAGSRFAAGAGGLKFTRIWLAQQIHCWNATKRFVDCAPAVGPHNACACVCAYLIPGHPGVCGKYIYMLKWHNVCMRVGLAGHLTVKGNYINSHFWMRSREAPACDAEESSIFRQWSTHTRSRNARNAAFDCD